MDKMYQLPLQEKKKRGWGCHVTNFTLNFFS